MTDPAAQPARPRLTFFLDADNTLLDNDAAKREMDRRLGDLLGQGENARFWTVYEEVRGELGVVDIPRTMSRFLGNRDAGEVRYALADLFMRFPFADFVYPDSADVLRHLRRLGRVAILSDGDQVFQTAKIGRSGLADAVDHFVLVFAHKEEHLPEIAAAFPADRHVFVDDKPGVLERIGARMPTPFSTVFVRQGKYAAAVPPGPWPGATLTVEGIGDVGHLGAEDFLAAG